MEIKTNAQAEEQLVLLDGLKRQIKEKEAQVKEIQAALEEFMGEEEYKKLGVGEMFYKTTAGALKVDEAKLAADSPKIFEKCLEKIFNSKILKNEYPDVYDEYTIGGGELRRFTYKLDAQKIIKKTEKKVRKEYV